jgi:hypothetical protein
MKHTLLPEILIGEQKKIVSDIIKRTIKAIRVMNSFAFEGARNLAKYLIFIYLLYIVYCGICFVNNDLSL